MRSVSHPVVETFAARKKRQPCGAAPAALPPPPERIKMQVFQCCLGEMVLSIFISKPLLHASKQWVDRTGFFWCFYFAGVEVLRRLGG